MGTVVGNKTTAETNAWFQALTADQIHGIEVTPVAADGTLGTPIYALSNTRPLEAPPKPIFAAWAEAVFGANPKVVFEFTETTGAHTYQARVKDSSGVLVKAWEWAAITEGTNHQASTVVAPDGAYSVELDAINEVGIASRLENQIGVGVYAGGGGDGGLQISHRTGTKFTFDRTTRFPAYMAGQVLVDGDPAARDVLVIDRRTQTLLYRPRVGTDGRWEVRNITNPPRRDWRAYLVIARDPQARYNSQIIDHVKPVILDPGL